MESSRALISEARPSMRFYDGVLRCLRPLYRLFFRLETRGEENLPENDGFYLVANHISNHDPLFVSLALRRRVRYMAKKELFTTPVVCRLVKALGAFPIDRGNIDLNAVRTAIDCVKHGETVGVFPQGHRCIGKPATSMPPKNGLGMLVGRTRSTVVPVAVVTKGNRARIFRRVTVIVGKPIPFDSFGVEGRSGEDYAAITDKAFGAVTALMPEENR